MGIKDKLIKRKNKGNKENEEEYKLQYVGIIISGPNKVDIRMIPPEELPPSVPMSHAVEIRTPDGKVLPGFLLVGHNLVSAVDVPLVEEYLERYRYIPLDVKSIYDTKIEEYKHDLYSAFEIALAGKWARLVYDKSFEFEEKKEFNIPKWLIIVIAIIAIFVALNIMTDGGLVKFIAKLVGGASSHAVTPPPKPVPPANTTPTTQPIT